MKTMAAVEDLSHVLKTWRDDAQVLKRRGDARGAAFLERCASEALAVAEDFTRWLSEGEAALRAGWSTDQVRRHARKFLNTPYVRYEKRQYAVLACIVPRRAHDEMLREAAQQGVA